MRILGYRNGFRYLTDEKNVFRNDAADPPDYAIRFYCTRSSFAASIKAYGPLSDEEGEEIMMAYPTIEQVKAADREQICRWYRFLPSPGESASGTPAFNQVLSEEATIMNAIVARCKEFGGFTPDISKKIGFVKVPNSSPECLVPCSVCGNLISPESGEGIIYDDEPLCGDECLAAHKQRTKSEAIYDSMKEGL